MMMLVYEMGENITKSGRCTIYPGPVSFLLFIAAHAARGKYTSDFGTPVGVPKS